MSKSERTETLLGKDIFEQINFIDSNPLEIGKKDLNAKIDKIGGKSIKIKKDDNKKYKLNLKEFQDDFESQTELLLLEDCTNASEIKDKKNTKINNDYLNNPIIEKSMNNKKSKEDEIFGEESLPIDDELIDEPPDINLELSDVELGDNQQEELEFNNNNNITKLDSTEINQTEENNYQFTEYVLKQAKSPADMIDICEKIEDINYKNDERNKKTEII